MCIRDRAQWEGITDPKIIDGVDILEATGVLDEYVVYGSNAEWKALVDFCKTHDMNNAADREYLLSQIDVDNWFTHAAYAMIIGNADANNTRYYRFPGGKWKFMVHDLDVGCSNGDDLVVDLYPVSYTHLDVYKRQDSDTISLGYKIPASSQHRRKKRGLVIP